MMRVYIDPGHAALFNANTVKVEQTYEESGEILNYAYTIRSDNTLTITSIEIQNVICSYLSKREQENLEHNIPITIALIPSSPHGSFLESVAIESWATTCACVPSFSAWSLSIDIEVISTSVNGMQIEARRAFFEQACATLSRSSERRFDVIARGLALEQPR